MRQISSCDRITVNEPHQRDYIDWEQGGTRGYLALPLTPTYVPVLKTQQAHGRRYLFSIRGRALGLACGCRGLGNLRCDRGLR